MYLISMESSRCVQAIVAMIGLQPREKMETRAKKMNIHNKSALCNPQECIRKDIRERKVEKKSKNVDRFGFFLRVESRLHVKQIRISPSSAINVKTIYYTSCCNFYNERCHLHKNTIKY